MNTILNSQICLNCRHEKKWHKISLASNHPICHGLMQLTYEHPGYGMICTCNKFKMDNLIYLEKLNERSPK